MNMLSKNLLNATAMVFGGVYVGCKAGAKVCSQGHKVATGLRKAADGIDAASTWSENKCNQGAELAEALKQSYAMKALGLTPEQVAAAYATGVQQVAEEPKKEVKAEVKTQPAAPVVEAEIVEATKQAVELKPEKKEQPAPEVKSQTVANNGGFRIVMAGSEDF